MLWSEVLEEYDYGERAKRLKLARGMLTMVGATSILAFTLSLFMIESVMLTGIILGIFGILAVHRSFRCGAGAGVVVGVLAVVLPLSMFVAVNAYHWSPRQAETPFALIGGAAFMAFVFGIAMARRQLDALSWPAPPSTQMPMSTLLPVPDRDTSR